MATTTLTVSIDWPTIHSAAKAVDTARRGSQLGSGNGYDAFGGSYFGASYEQDGLCGLHRIANAAAKIAEESWAAIHQASAMLRDATASAVPVVCVRWRAVGAPGRADVGCASHRGAATRATRYGGSVVREAWIDEVATAAERAKKIARVEALVQAAVRTALALHDLMLTAYVAQGGSPDAQVFLETTDDDFTLTHYNHKLVLVTAEGEPPAVYLRGPRKEDW